MLSRLQDGFVLQQPEADAKQVGWLSLRVTCLEGGRSGAGRGCAAGWCASQPGTDNKCVQLTTLLGLAYTLLPLVLLLLACASAGLCVCRFHSKTGFDREIRLFCRQQGITYQRCVCVRHTGSPLAACACVVAAAGPACLRT